MLCVKQYFVLILCHTILQFFATASDQLYLVHSVLHLPMHCFNSALILLIYIYIYIYIEIYIYKETAAHSLCRCYVFVLDKFCKCGIFILLVGWFTHEVICWSVCTLVNQIFDSVSINTCQVMICFYDNLVATIVILVSLVVITIIIFIVLLLLVFIRFVRLCSHMKYHAQILFTALCL